jgi:tetratricopeptide (TPR) repeat protein
MSSTTTSLQTRAELIAPIQRPTRLLALPWRDPHSVPTEKLAEFIESLTQACGLNPDNADIRTCLGIAHAMNYDPQRSMDTLEEALRIEPENYLAQLKYAELLFRLRIIERAETETLRALELAGNNWELAVARRQLSEVRQLRRKGLSRPAWTKSLKVPIIGFLLLLLGASWIYVVWK